MFRRSGYFSLQTIALPIKIRSGFKYWLAFERRTDFFFYALSYLQVSNPPNVMYLIIFIDLIIKCGFIVKFHISCLFKKRNVHWWHKLGSSYFLAKIHRGKFLELQSSDQQFGLERWLKLWNAFGVEFLSQVLASLQKRHIKLLRRSLWTNINLKW